MKIELSSCLVGKPAAQIDLINPPENLEDIVADYFADYTSGTNPDYLCDDKLAYIDLLREKIHPEKEDGYEAVKKRILDACECQLDDESDLPDMSEFLDLDFIGSCYELGDRALYSDQYGYKRLDHHQYDKIHQTLCRIIKTVMNWEYEKEEHAE